MITSSLSSQPFFSAQYFFTFKMAEIGNSPELHSEISKNESLALQVLLIAFGFVAELYFISFVNDNGVKLSTVIAYAALSYYFWNMYKGILGRPNVFKRRGEPIKPVDFVIYLFAGFTGLMVAIYLYNSVLYALDCSIPEFILLLISILFGGIAISHLLLNSLLSYEGWCDTVLPLAIYTTAAFGFWYLIKAIRYASNAFKSRGNSDLLRASTINLLVAIIVLSVAWYVNDLKGTIRSQISSYASSSSSGSFYVHEIPIPESEKRRYGLN